MKTNKILNGRKITLRQISIKDCTDKYVSWLNDSKVNKFLETRHYKQNINTIKEFVTSQLENNHSFMFAIINNNQHIGNIKLGPINPYHNHSSISYFIGEKECWGKGFATEAIHLICKYAFEELNLHKLESGTYSEAIGSWKALEKNDFKREGILREEVLSDGKYIDVYRYGLLKKEYYQKKGEEKNEILY